MPLHVNILKFCYKNINGFNFGGMPQTLPEGSCDTWYMHSLKSTKSSILEQAWPQALDAGSPSPTGAVTLRGI